MDSEKIPQDINLTIKAKGSNDVLLLSKEEQDKNLYKNSDVGPSSLYGRRGDNITFHAQGVYTPGYWERQWSWVWKDLRDVFFGLFRIFFSREK